MRTLENAGVYWNALIPAQQQGMLDLFQQLKGSELLSFEPIMIEGRAIPNWGHTDTLIGFDFKVLCHEPRSQRDYLSLAEQFPMIFVSNVPEIAANEHNKITYFIQLIDILYDAHVKLVLSADAVKVQDIYKAGPLSFEFERIQSRLTEMQTHDYLARAK